MIINNSNNMTVEEYNLSKISVFYGFILVFIYWLILSSFINSLIRGTKIIVEPSTSERSISEQSLIK